MPSPKELGWGTELINGKLYYTCQGEKTPNIPQIRCDLPAGWEHRLSKSTGKMYYSCTAAQLSQYSPPTKPCNEKTKPKETGTGVQEAKRNPLPTDLNVIANDKKLNGTAKPALPPSGAGIPQATRAPISVLTTPTSTKMHVTVNTANGKKKGFNVVETETPQGGGKSTYNKTRRNKNRKNRSKRNRKNKNRS